MTKTEIALTNLIKTSLFGIQTTFEDDVDWGDVLKEAQAQTVVSLVAKSAPKGVIDWNTFADEWFAHFVRLLFEQTKLVNLLNEAKIPFVIIKGSAAAIYYPQPYNRTMGDIDILVSEENFEVAFSHLKENGYNYSDSRCDSRDYKFSKDGIVIELHRKYSDEEHDIEKYIKYGIGKPEIQTILGEKFPTLPKAQNGLVLLDHVRHHIVGGLGIRQIIDFMMFVNSEPDEEKFVSNYLFLFEEVGLGTLAKVITKMCKRYFGLPVSASWCETADDRTCEELLETLFFNGNFGRKNRNEYRPMQSVTMSIKKRGFFRTLQEGGKNNCEAFRKYKILRPFAWIYQLFRYINRGIVALFRGENLIKDVSYGKQKIDFYKRLGIM